MIDQSSMKKCRLHTLIAAITLFALYSFTIFFSNNAYANMPPQEASLINELLNTVENSEAVFIRNNTEHSPKEAVKHLKMKLNRAGSRIKTANDFIRVLATKSSFSGKAYMLRFSDGTMVESGLWFTNKLLKLRNTE